MMVKCREAGGSGAALRSKVGQAALGAKLLVLSMAGGLAWGEKEVPVTPAS